MARYRLTIEYDGSDFVGWQAQAHGRSIQETIEAAIGDFCGEATRLTAAGRTDAGVHAIGQVAHVDLVKDWPADIVRDALNAHLRRRRAAVVILRAEIAAPEFNARFSAKGRRYLYRLLARRAPPVLDRNRVWHLSRQLEIAAMRAAAALLVGRHDFTTFRATACQAKSALRTLDRFDCVAVGEELHFHAAARSFLHHQVRSMVGSVVNVGLGRWQVEEVAAALAARDRSRCGPTAPAWGLCLVGVDY